MDETKAHPYPIDEVLQKKPWSVADGFRYCERLARTHYENFPVGSALIPKKLRPYVWAIYAFARRADDIADEDFLQADRLPALQAWQGLLDRSAQTRVNHPVFLALAETLRRFQIPRQLCADLVTAFKMDVVVKRYPSFKDLLFYCRHSANPVGRFILHLFGYASEDRMFLSDRICTALQLANFWQDVAVDLDKGRIYIPVEELQRFQIPEAELFAKQYSTRFRELLRFQVERTEIMLREGAPLIDTVRGRLRLELKCTVLGGMGILEKIRKLDYNTLATRPHFNKRDKAAILWKAVTGFNRALKRAPGVEARASEPEAPIAPAISEPKTRGEGL
jgi:squalene synthase HpnC